MTPLPKPSGTGPVNPGTRPTILIDIIFEPDMIHGIMETALDLGWRLFNLQHLRGNLPAGLTPIGALVTQSRSHPTVKRIRKRGWPIVRVSVLGIGDTEELPTVTTDRFAAGQLAAEFFAERGFRHLAYVRHIPWGCGRHQFSAFEARGKELGCQCHHLRLVDHPASDKKEADRIYRAHTRQVRKWLGELPKPVAFLGYHDQQAAAVCANAIAAGLSVPEEIAILGVGNVQLHCESAQVPLSSIERGDEEIGRQSVLLLKRLIDGDAVSETSLLLPPYGVVERRSTDVLAVPNPAVARALRFLWDHLAEPLSVNDIVKESGVSRPTLERGFRRCLHRGINAELLRKRLEACCRLLTTTDLILPEVAKRTGFNSTVYLHRAFRKAFGMTPAAYRKAH